MPRVEDERIVESATEARAAVTGHNVRYVLLISTLAVIVLFTVIYIRHARLSRNITHHANRAPNCPALF